MDLKPNFLKVPFVLKLSGKGRERAWDKGGRWRGGGFGWRVRERSRAMRAEQSEQEEFIFNADIAGKRKYNNLMATNLCNVMFFCLAPLTLCQKLRTFKCSWGVLK